MTYLDYAADAPLHPMVSDAIADAIKTISGAGANPSSLHGSGRRAKEFLEQSRARLAAVVGCDPHEVVFTGGGTEADTLAVLGIASARYKMAPALGTIVASVLEHDAIVHTSTYLGQYGIRTERIGVDRDSVIDLDFLRANLAQYEPALVAVMAVCNENGVIQPIPEVVDIVRHAETHSDWDRESTAMAGATHVPIVVDAVQALGRIPLEFHQWGIDAMAIAGHKIGGPVNSGALIATRELPVNLPGHGASQERGIRPGTQDVIAAAALATAAERAEEQREEESRRLALLRQRLVKEACAIQGVQVATKADSVPDITQFVLSECEAESMLFVFDQEGICVSAGSACRSGVARPSPVLVAQGFSDEEAMGGLRVSMGWGTTVRDIEHFLQVLPRAIEISRKAAKRKQERKR